MQKFLTKFAIFVLVYLGLNAGINYAIFQNTKLKLDGVKTIICGDSHPQRSLYPRRFDAALNISQSAEPYVLTYWKLRYLFQHHKPDTLLIGFAHHNISAFNDLKFWHPVWAGEMFRRTYLIGNYRSLETVRIDYRKYFDMFVRQMFLYPHMKHITFMGGYANQNTSNISDVKRAISRHYYFRKSELGISDTSILYLDRILKLCKKNDVIPVLIGSPVHRKYFDLIPTEIKQRYTFEKERFKKENLMVLDFTEDVYEDSFYLNADHLNKKGSIHFTDKINLLLKKSKAKQGHFSDE